MVSKVSTARSVCMQYVSHRLYRKHATVMDVTAWN